MKETWKSWKWLLCLLPITAAIIFVAWRTQPEEPIITLAELPVEDEVTFDLETNPVYSSEDGIVVIPASGQEQNQSKNSQTVMLSVLSDPEQIWEESSPLSTDRYTLPEEITIEDGSIGTLAIPKLNLTAPVYEPEAGGEMESMTKGIAHFAVTSAWEGNIGLASHNEAPAGAVAYFRDIHLLEPGDAIVYKTSLGERQYQVTKVQEIADDDWSFLAPNADGENRITLITCITGKPNKRLMVQAEQENFVGVSE
jgi:LPXTG-site transpeptidase (sortase) family protein